MLASARPVSIARSSSQAAPDGLGGNCIVGSGQGNWKWGNKCMAMAFAGIPTVWPCTNTHLAA